MEGSNVKISLLQIHLLVIPAMRFYSFIFSYYSDSLRAQTVLRVVVAPW